MQAKEKEKACLYISKATEILEKNQDFQKLLESLTKNNASIALVSAAARPYFVASVNKSLDNLILLITPNRDRAKFLMSDISAFTNNCELYQDIETMPYDSLSPSASSVGRYFSALDNIQTGNKRVWIATIHAAIRALPSPIEKLHKPLEIAIGEENDLYEFIEKLVNLGYVRSPIVEENGQFSVRGGIIDVFASQMEVPLRIEFFGDEIESIRTFNISTQRSVDNLKYAKIYGCKQLSLTNPRASNIAEQILSNLTGSSEWLETEIGKIKDLCYFDGVEKYLPFFYNLKYTIFDYLPDNALVIFDEPEEIFQVAENYYLQQKSYVEHLIKHNAIVKPPNFYYVNPQTINKLDKKRIDLVSIGNTRKYDIKLKASPVQPSDGRTGNLIKTTKEMQERGFKVILALNDYNQVNRLSSLLEEDGIKTSAQDILDKRTVSLTIGTLSKGFESKDIGLAIITSSDILGKQQAQQKVYHQHKGKTISSIVELKIGDYVVHSTHGIAIYAGLRRREVAGVVRDYALLEYAGNDRLFVPVDHLDRITKYIGASGETPTISRLGSSDWIRAKRKAKASVKKVAYDLLSLYALRANTKGYAFSVDTPWQAELEQSFPYDETPDQFMAIEDVKRDMESQKPMDRLICGDVGYGKTEVAVRAAFKAVMDSKQVMVLVPTTILAQQHYKTFSERLSIYPVTVEMISRFKTPSQQKDIVERFNKGKIDILIGTHRLLASDVHPFDLGLVVIDEEQRFGVNDKEKLRNFKKSIDVLTLSATPIPRTLQMSLAGVRDMSIIETPPEGRHPIITHVGRYDEEMIIQAVRRELLRGGQVYYVHNRVETIGQVANRIQELIPEAKIAVAHGQMNEHTLEKIMISFLDKQFDVLVCTTIIESGIDIPNVNTLIVDRAELLGLAQLYQLRGRVGRTNRRAYAYFFYTPQRLMTTQAFERLKTISDYTDLGSGIKIALRDLEIRGAGNLLGAEQHGHMSSVGFELYCQMLKEAIDELEGKTAPEQVEIKIDLPVDAYIPDKYIAEESLRVEIYKRIIGCKSVEEITDLYSEFKDRFGVLPKPVLNLIEIAKIRIKAQILGINEIVYQSNKLKISPIKLNKHQVMLLQKNYANLIIRPDREYIKATLFEKDKIIAFIAVLLDDIISEPSCKAANSQKVR